MSDAKTIQIFLPDGEPRGIRIAEITTRIIQAVQVPRARLDRVMSRPELAHIGAYFLFGEYSISSRATTSFAARGEDTPTATALVGAALVVAISSSGVAPSVG